MNKITYILGCTLAALSLQSCDKYLDLVPKGESVLNTTSDYLGLLEDMNGYPVDDERYLCGDVTSHNMTNMKNYTYPVMSACFFWNEEYDRAQYMNKSGTIDMYSMCYQRIAKYNIVLGNIEKAEGSTEDKVMGIAQAKAMRAYNYFYLINTYAKPYNPQTAATDRGIIIRSDFSIETEGTQGTVAQAYELIQQDLEDAIKNLPEKAINNFRPDKAFGYALKAKVHLYKREIDKALQASLDAISIAKANGRKLWDMNIDYKKTIDGINAMYPVPFPESFFWPNGMMHSMITSMSMMYFNHSYEDPENLLYQHGSTSMDPMPMFVRKPVVDLYDDNTDLRHLLLLMKMNTRPTSEEGSRQFIVSNVKWNVGGMKLSEVYLMAAECYARQNNPDKAMEYLNILRKNRHRTAGYKDFTATDGEQAMKLVREERKRELMLTSNGFFDMRRFATEFNETNTKVIEGTTYTLKPDSHLYIFPFPVAAMQNSNLIQNSK